MSNEKKPPNALPLTIENLDSIAGGLGGYSIRLGDGKNKEDYGDFDRSVYVEAGGGDDTIKGTDFSDYIYGEEGNDHLVGREGDDTLDGEAGNDKVEGGDGNDLVSGGAGNDTLDGGAGNDIVSSLTWNEAGGDDYLRGGEGNDTLQSGSGEDTMAGGSGNDTVFIRPGSGHDVAQGGSGRDTLELWGFGGDKITFVFESGGFLFEGKGELIPGTKGVAHFASGGSVTFAGFERIIMT